MKTPFSHAASHRETAANASASRGAFSSAVLHRDFFARLLLLAAACCCIGDGAPYWGDIGLYFQPLVALQSAALREGQIALWNPFIYCGATLAGNAQAWLFYPPAWPMAVLPTPLFLAFFLAFHIFLAGAFCHAFLRRSALRLGAAPALLGAITYMFGGCVVSKTQFPNMTAALAWLPLILLFTERLVRRPSYARALPLGGALAMQILAAHAQITVFTVYLALIYAAWWLRISPRASQALAKRRRRTLLGAAALAFGFALSFSCAQWLPVLDSVRETSRGGMSLEEAHRFFLPLNQLTNFFWPHRLGNPTSGTWRGIGNTWETACYLGIVPFALALLLILRAARTRSTAGTAGATRRSLFASAPRGEAPLFPARRRALAARFWIFIAILSIVLGLGATGVLYLLAWLFVPGIRAFHDTARLLMGASLALPVLAALGAQHVLSIQKTQRAKALCGALLVALSLLDLGVYAHGFYPKRSLLAAPIGDYLPVEVAVIQSDAFVRSGQGRIFMPDSSDSWESFTSIKRFGPNTAGRYAQWQATLTPNLGLPRGLREAGGYEPLSNLRIKLLTQRARYALQAPSARKRGAAQKNDDRREYFRREKMRREALPELAVRYLVVFRKTTPHFPSMTPVFVSAPRGVRGERTIVLRNDDFAPRLRWLAPQEENAAAPRRVSSQGVSAQSSLARRGTSPAKRDSAVRRKGTQGAATRDVQGENAAAPRFYARRPEYGRGRGSAAKLRANAAACRYVPARLGTFLRGACA